MEENDGPTATGETCLEESIKRVVIEYGKTSLNPGELETATAEDVPEPEKVVTVVSASAEEQLADGSEKDVEGVKDAEAAAVPAEEESDSDSEDDLQLIVNDEDFFYPNGIEGAEEGEGEEMYAVAGDERYDEVDWTTEMHYHHSQFKYVRPGSGASPGIPDGTPGSKGQLRPQMPFMPGPYMMGQWFQPCYEFVLPPSKTVFEIDLDQFEDKPWEYPGVDITDYFNFGFTEDTWKHYCEDVLQARVRSDMSMRGRGRGYENGHQGYGMDRDGHHHRGRQGSRSMRNQMMDEYRLERRPSGDMRRQRLSDPGSIIQIPLEDDMNNDYRRQARNDEFTTPYSQRRRDFMRQGEQLSSHLSSGGRRMAGSAGMTRPATHPVRSRMPHPSSGRHSIDNTGRPWRKFSLGGRADMAEEHSDEEDQGSYGTSDSQERSEDEYIAHAGGHRGERVPDDHVTVRRAGRLAAERRLMEDRETRTAQAVAERRPEKRIISSGHYQEKPAERKKVVEEKEPSSPARTYDRNSLIEKRSQLLTERKRSWQVLSENRLGRRQADDEDDREEKASPPASPLPAERRRSQLLQRRTAPRRPLVEPVKPKEPSPEPVIEKKKTRAELIAERRAAQMIARQKLAQVIAEERSVEVTTEKVTTEKLGDSLTREVKTSKVTTIKKVEPKRLEPQREAQKVEPQPRIKRQDNAGKDDLRMKVLERVSARWKMHLRMDDAQAKRKRDSSAKAGSGRARVDRQEEPFEYETADGATREVADGRGHSHEDAVDGEQQDEDEDVERGDSRRDRRRKEKRDREERRQRHRERKEQRRSRVGVDEENEYEDEYEDYDERVDERWQMEDTTEEELEYRSSRVHSRSKKRKRHGEEDDDDEVEEEPRKRSSSRRSGSHGRRSHRDDVEYDEDEEGAAYMDHEDYVESGWDGDRWNGYEDGSAHQRSSKRRKHYKDAEDFDEGDYDYDQDDYGQGRSGSVDDDYYYKDSRNSRWTGRLHESDEEEYGRYEA